MIFLVHFKTTRRHLPVIKELRERVATAGDGACWPEERGEADSAALRVREYSEWHGLDGKWACSSHLWFRPQQRESVPRRHCYCYRCDRRQLAAVHKSCEVCRGRRVELEVIHSLTMKCSLFWTLPLSTKVTNGTYIQHIWWTLPSRYVTQKIMHLSRRSPYRSHVGSIFKKMHPIFISCKDKSLQLLHIVW